MTGSRAGSSLLKRRYPYIAASILVFLVVVLVWAAVAPAASMPGLNSRERATFSFGGGHILVIKADGSLWAVGSNDAGQLGTSDAMGEFDFVRVGSDTDWVSVAAGLVHSLAVKSDGSLWAWGSNEYGQVGDGGGVDRWVPTRIGTDNDWATVYAGGMHSMAIKGDGSLWCWGEGGQLGDGTTEDRVRPMRIGSANDWLAVFTGWFHTFAIKTDGSLWGWGDNEAGQLGDGTKIDGLVPTRVGSSNSWVCASAGFTHSLGVMADGSLWSWGDNEVGQLGDGKVVGHLVPARVGSENQWARVSAGGVTSLAIKQDGSLWSWGVLDWMTEDVATSPAPLGAATKWIDVNNSMLMVAGLKADGTLAEWLFPGISGLPFDLSSPIAFLEGVRLPTSIPLATPTTTASTTTTTTASTTTTTAASTTTTTSIGGTTTTTTPARTFSDVPATHPYYAAISAMAGQGVVSGYPDGTFGVDREVLRKHLAKMIVGTMGLPVTETDWQDDNPPFTDCGPDDPASLYPHDYIAVAKANGLTAGKTATTFAPEANITKAQMITMVVRAAQNAGVDLKAVDADYNGPFKNYDDPYHGANVRLADYNGLLQGVLTGINPSAWIAGNATRGEVAQVLWNLKQLLK